MLKFALLLVGLVGVLGGRPPLRRYDTVQEVVPEADADYRLPATITPLRYNLLVEPNFTAKTFTGALTITAVANTVTNAIVMNIRDIAPSSVSVTSTFAHTIFNTTIDTVHEFYTINLAEGLAAGSLVSISIQYVGVLGNGNSGFYFGQYVNELGATIPFGTTQFEATNAREAFPCFDEPALKAIFEINIIRPANYSSISNMRLSSSQQLSANRILDSFQSTPVMSTYLIAFIVSDFGHVQDANGENAVYATNYHIQAGDADYALYLSPLVLGAMQTYTNVSYPLSKMYQAALPDPYFAAGAMENWGMVTYREVYTFYREGKSTEDDKEGVATIITHEFAHQNFGDITTPFWWSYIWLNEGFATFFEYYATAILYPDWQLRDRFVTTFQQYAFGPDSSTTTRAMTVPAGSPLSIGILFDVIAYDKSGSVLRMIMNFLSENVWQKGLNKYLNARSYNYSTPDYLFEGLQEAVTESGTNYLGGFTVKQIGDTWHLQAGYPIVNAFRSYSTGAVNLTQNRYLSNGLGSAQPELWYIPIRIQTPTSGFLVTTPTNWFTTKAATLPVTAASSEWIILSPQATVYCRVNYDESNWALITSQLIANPTVIHRNNRAQLIDDITDLATTNDVTYTQALNLYQYIAKESEIVPLTSLWEAIYFINKNLNGYAVLAKFASNFVNLLQLAYSTDGGVATLTDHVRILNRVDVVYWACYLGNANCLSTYQTQLLNAGPNVDPNLQSCTYCGGNRKGDSPEQTWSVLYNKYSNAATGSLERGRLVTAFGCTSNVNMEQRVLQSVTGRNPSYSFLPGDKYNLVRAVYQQSYQGTLTAFDDLLTNLSAYQFSFSTSQISAFIDGITFRLTQQSDRTRLQNFINANNLGTLTSSFQAGLANIDANLAWYSKYGSQFVQFYP